jgi:signal transduction histidine kinase/ActR/RegA family two-component response regulator
MLLTTCITAAFFQNLRRPDTSICMPYLAENTADGDAFAYCEAALRNCHEQPDGALRAVGEARKLLSSARLAGPQTLRILEKCAEAAAWANTRLCRQAEAERELSQARELSRRLGDARGLAECELIAAFLANKRGALVEAAERSQRAVAAFERLNDGVGTAKALNAAGLVTVSLGDLRAALQSFEAARIHAERAGDLVTRSYSLGHIGWIYFQLGHLDDAEPALLNALDACRDAQNRRGVANVLDTLGDLHDVRGNLDESLRCFEEACEIYAELRDPEGEAFTHVRLIRVRGKLGDWAGARRAYEAVESLSKPGGLRRSAVQGKFEFAQCLLTQAAVADSPDGPGLRLMDEALAEAEQSQFRVEQASIHEALWKYYKKHGHLAEALHHHEQLSLVRRETLSSEAQAQAARVKIQHDVERSQQETEQQRQRVEELSVLNAEIERQRKATEALSAQLSEKVRALEEEMAVRHKLEEERLALERQMMETQKLESLGVLASAIAHDFNNLLTVIVGNADLVRMKNAGNPALIQPLDSILSAAARAGNLCQQMLEFAGKGNTHRVPLTVGPLVKESLELAQSAFAPSCTTSSHLEPDVPSVHADPAQIRQVIVNLLLNAGEAIGKGTGEITVSTRTMTLDSKRAARLKGAASLPGGTYVCIEVADTGPGMVPEVLNRVFEPFFTTRFLGRGLGLPAALGIVRSHGGGIEIESAPGRGTCVRVFLPPISVPEETPRSATPGETNGEWRANGAILVADDEPSLRDVMHAACSQFGFEVIVAADGAEALRLFRENQHRVVAALLDFQMPHYDGAFVCRRILQARPGLPVILMSGFSEQESITNLTTDHPGVVFLPKPFGIPKLRALLQSTMAHLT